MKAVGLQFSLRLWVQPVSMSRDRLGDLEVGAGKY